MDKQSIAKFLAIFLSIQCLPSVEMAHATDSATKSGEIEPDICTVHPKHVVTEEVQLSEIWTATLNDCNQLRSKLDELMPNKDQKHATTVRLKMLSIATLHITRIGVGDFEAGIPEPTTTEAGTGLVMQILCGNINHSARSRRLLSETDAAMIWLMITDLHRQTLAAFHNYKKDLLEVSRLSAEYEHLQSTESSNSAKTESEREFLIRKTRREIELLNEDTRKTRESLVELAGIEAVNHLDEEIASIK